MFVNVFINSDAYGTNCHRKEGATGVDIESATGVGTDEDILLTRNERKKLCQKIR